MVEIAKLLLMMLARVAVAEEARGTVRGREGRMARVMLVFPLFLLGLFGYIVWLGSAGSADPEKVVSPKEAAIGWTLGTLIPLGLLLLILHFLTFRVWLSDGFLHSSGLLGRMRMIDLSQPFEFEYNEVQESFKVTQNGVKIRIVRMVDGYPEFLEKVLEAQQKQPGGGG